MCGLAAFFSTRPDAAIAGWLKQSIDLASHRGPDGRGFAFANRNHVDPEARGPIDWGMGHARLAILGLGEQGDQPMPSIDGNTWLVYNGEIYNYIELREELAGLGHEIFGDTDTEVIHAAWAAWGPACVERFNGMFAFVLVDLQKKTVFAARDRLGIKPLYFWKGDSGTAIVSEPKQLRAFPGFQARADLQLVQDFLVDGVMEHEPGRCMFVGVQPLPPAHRLQWSLGSMPDTTTAECYWSMTAQTERMSWEDAVASTRHRVIESVRLRMRSDVPVGSCLSGGTDSSSIVSIVSRELEGRISTFSSCFEDPRFDEQQWIDVVNASCTTDPVKIFPSEDEAGELLDQLHWHQDEPFTSMSLYAQWCVMRAAREHDVPVLLDGQGGDESFCGYRKFAFFHLRELLSRGRLLAASRHATGLLLRGDRRLLHFGSGQRYLPKMLRRPEEPGLSLREPLESVRGHAWSDRMASTRALAEHRIADLQHWSLPVLLRFEDRNSMAHGIEARVPFVDHELIEHCLRIPPAYFFRKGRSKGVLLEAMRGILPEQVRKRRTKMGFETPQVTWMRGAFGKLVVDRLEGSEMLAELIDVPRLVEAAGNPGKDWLRVQSTAFRAASLATWARIFDVRS